MSSIDIKLSIRLGYIIRNIDGINPSVGERDFSKVLKSLSYWLSKK